MRRLVQFGTFVFILVTFLAPLAECFDRWDAPGIFDDTEFAVFALVLALSLVLVVCLLLAARSLLHSVIADRLAQRSADFCSPAAADPAVAIFIPPRLHPLRI